MKAILTVIGNDKPGIIAKICSFLADRQCNIEDISQTILQGKLTMVMLVDFHACPEPLAALVEEAKKLGESIGVSVYLQHEDIFNAMHTIDG